MANVKNMVEILFSKVTVNSQILFKMLNISYLGSVTWNFTVQSGETTFVLRNQIFLMVMIVMI